MEIMKLVRKLLQEGAKFEAIAAGLNVSREWLRAMTETDAFKVFSREQI